MYLSDHLHHGNGNKAGKFAIVAALHVAVAMVFVKSINTKHLSLPKMPEQVLVMIEPEIPKPPPPPPEPPKPQPKAAPPEVVVPKVEVETPPPEVESPVQATTIPDPAPQPSAPVQAEAPPAEPSNSGAMRTASLADAEGCATPEYPANAARNGETGTVTLALLIGADGKVNSSRIQKSSGSRELDRAAINALSLCRFKPAMNGGTAQAGWAQLAYVWKLDE